MSNAEAFSSNILDNMSDGVLTVDMQGTVTMFNPAAASILGMEHEGVTGRKFAEVFFAVEGNDAFTQLVLDAIYDSAAGESTTLRFHRPDGSEVVLGVTSSYLRDAADAPRGVILVFSDITEITRLKQEQEDLNRQLTQAYLDLESTHRDLSANFTRGRRVRMLAVALVIMLFTGVGVAFWLAPSQSLQEVRDLTSDLPGFGTPAPSATDPQKAHTVPVREQAISNTISLTGTLAPLEQVNVIAPFAGNLVAEHYEIGQTVSKGDALVKLGTEDIRSKMREAKAQYIKAKKKYNEVMHWKSGAQAAKARRELATANRKMEQAKQSLEESKLLFKKNIIPRTELENARETWRGSLSSYKSARENLTSVLEQGSSANLEIARMELQNAEENLKSYQRKFEQSVVRAPVNGVVLKPVVHDDKNKEPLAVGAPVKEGQVLFTVGNLKGMSVDTRVDEVDIMNVHRGQKVKITGDAFPATELTGVIRHISAQATKGPGGSPGFDVKVIIERMTEAQKRVARLGMTANLEVVVYENPHALLVPVRAVFRHGEGHAVRVLRDGAVRIVPVSTGITTVTSVEITKGLKKGEQVVLPRGGTGR